MVDKGKHAQRATNSSPQPSKQTSASNASNWSSQIGYSLVRQQTLVRELTHRSRDTLIGVSDYMRLYACHEQMFRDPIQ